MDKFTELQLEEPQKEQTTDVKVIPTWKEKFMTTILPEEGKYFSYFFGLVFDGTGFLLWILLINVLLTQDEMRELWFMPFIGVLGATVAMSTPAGGGIFYFPAITALRCSPQNAVAFNLAGQSTGMGLFGAASWIRKSRDSIIFWVVGLATFTGWIGTLLSLAVEVHQELPLRIIFLIFSFLLLLYVIYLLWKDKTKDVGEIEKSIKNIAILSIFGLLGGIISGYIGVGTDMIIFAVLSAVYKVDSRKATATSVLVMGWTSVFPALIHLFYFQDVPVNLWLMAIGGSILGARFGVLIYKLLGRRKMTILFAFILVIEVIRTPIELILKNVVFINDHQNSTEVIDYCL
eukprot:TRINITY_DN9040_c0_g1_i1.p1 TRINITY_DN9040_c0_g1~~TRINITY_DN9040_c0_g1_i1.p1  ORF type:complete len:347 (+),score=44.10 TRINITY_DN9040_c0_g1_i1:32-1072(+)